MLFMNVSKQTFHISHVRISHKLKFLIINVRPSIYYFHMKTKILAGFQICISMALNNRTSHSVK